MDEQTQTPKGRIELVWGDTKCPKGLVPHQIGQPICRDCSMFDGEIECDWHREHTNFNFSDGKSKLDYFGNIVPREA